MTDAAIPHQPLTGDEPALLPPPARQSKVWRRLALTAAAVVVFVAALLVLGVDGLIPFGLLLAFGTGADEDETGRAVILTRRNLGLAAAMAAAFAWFCLWQLDLPEPMLVLIGGVLIALPLALQETVGTSRVVAGSSSPSAA